MIPVTKPFLPPQGDYHKMLDGIWEREWLTNMGPLATQLEERLGDYLGVKDLLFVTNGTVALQMAIKALNITGEIITTAFSFIATTSCIVWESCIPVFVDIDEKSLNIDASKIEAAITDKTQAILATHVYGNPCDVEAIEKIANKHGLKVIYDAAHAFGVEINGKSIFEYGDVSTCSLHATKLYHSIEGGFIVAKDPEVTLALRRIRNFGISGFDTFSHLGINGKNSEFHAAMGLVNLKYIKAISEKRKALSSLYDQLISGTSLRRPIWHKLSENNAAYYPVIFETEEQMLNCRKALEDHQIGTRRYFYPSLASALPYLEPKAFSITDSISSRVLCLPMYDDLSVEEVKMIAEVILKLISK